MSDQQGGILLTPEETKRRVREMFEAWIETAQVGDTITVEKNDPRTAGRHYTVNIKQGETQ